MYYVGNHFLFFLTHSHTHTHTHTVVKKSTDEDLCINYENVIISYYLWHLSVNPLAMICIS